MPDAWKAIEYASLPVTNRPAGEASHSAASAMSSGSPNILSGVPSIMALRMTSSVSTVSSADVATDPTAMAFTRTRGARSAASSRVMWVSAPFAVPYATKPRSRSWSP